MALNSFGELLRKHRLAVGLTQEAVAERAGLSVHGVQKLEQGVTHPYRHTTNQLVQALRLSSSEEAAFRSLAEPVARHRRATGAEPQATFAVPASVLPTALTSFVGRERELVEVVGLLGSARLVTLMGVGGCGKTRLAVEVARTSMDAYADGVCLVELAALTDGALVPQAIAVTLGIREVATQSIDATLSSTLRTRRLLLVLDNCEHLLDACAHVADTLLRTCPNLQILATSREALGLTGEVSWRVPSLPLPPVEPPHAADDLMDYASVRLFTERARAANPDFAITPRTASTIAQICRRLDGIPLALELAAVLVRGMSVEDLAARLDQRFRLLTGGSRAALPRQQTLRATIDWSFQLLSPPERLLLTRLAVFASSWTLESAEAVCGGAPLAPADVLGLLLHLVDKSLVVAERAEGDHQRYGLLETLRQFGREQLVASGDAECVHAAHGAYYLAVADEITPMGRRDSGVLARLAAEESDLESALDWFVERGDVDAAQRIAGVLWQLWEVRGRLRNGRRRLAAVLGMPQAATPTPGRARVLEGAGILALYHHDHTSARAHLKEALALSKRFGDEQSTAEVLFSLGWLSSDRGLRRAERGFTSQALERYERLHDRHGIARCLNLLGINAWASGDFLEASRRHTRSLALARELGDRWAIAWALHRLAVLSNSRVASGEAREAPVFPLIDEALAIGRDLGERRHFAFSLCDLAVAAAFDGNGSAARDHFRESLAVFSEQEDPHGLTWNVGLSAWLHESERNYERALWMSAAGLSAIRTRIGHDVPIRRLPRAYGDGVDRCRTAITSSAGAERADAIWAAGLTASLDDALDEICGTGPVDRV
jgi:predicted ATPase/transcriptional regulator with XRE-family HTH domain